MAAVSTIMRPTVACCWCWCGARLRLTPGPPPSPGHGAACRSDCGWCPPSAPARGKAPKHQASWQARRNSAAEVHQGGSCTPGSSAQQYAQGLCMCVQPQVCPKPAWEDRPEVTRPCDSRASSSSHHSSSKPAAGAA
ncbi:hypothetical protein OEZ85_008086 [Tetradesmus obliquus]|uniref:Secreted protein n=1 Tax=Tetradesmus obliquus TaxID=3088 RepID=A0ABY8TIC7_TETOB|nr:hypothetical protein OEZ85_008086 [Tetradesmus obliquus]